jgi:hypothetical protein
LRRRQDEKTNLNNHLMFSLYILDSAYAMVAPFGREGRQKNKRTPEIIVKEVNQKVRI